MQRRLSTIKALLHVGADRRIKSADFFQTQEELAGKLKTLGPVQERTVLLPIYSNESKRSWDEYLQEALNTIYTKDFKTEDHWLLLNIEFTGKLDDLKLETVLERLSNEFKETICYPQKEVKPTKFNWLKRLDSIAQYYFQSVLEGSEEHSLNIQNEIKCGFEWAFGRWLADWYLGHLDQLPSRREPIDPRLQTALEVPTLALTVSNELQYLIRDASSGPLAQELYNIKYRLAKDIGFVMPDIAFKLDSRLPSNTYRLYFREEQIWEGEAYPGHVLCKFEESEEHTRSIWVPTDQVASLEFSPISTQLPGEVIATEVGYVIRKQAWRMLSIDATLELLDILALRDPSLVMELERSDVPLRRIRYVLRDLLREGIPIRDLVTILEVILDYSDTVHQPELLTEGVRSVLIPAIFHTTFHHFKIADGSYPVVVFTGKMTDRLLTEQEKYKGLFSQDTHEYLVKQFTSLPRKCLLAVTPRLRRLIRSIAEQTHESLSVLSEIEIPEDAQVKIIKKISQPYKRKRNSTVGR